MITIDRNMSFILTSDINNKNHIINFEIHPKGALSISDLMGCASFFSTKDLYIKICGMIENMMGIDLLKEDRKNIINLIKKKYNIKYDRLNKNGFFSIIQHMLSVEYDKTPFDDGIRFIDLQTRNIRRTKSILQLKGCKYYYDATVKLTDKYSKDGKISQGMSISEEEMNTLPYFYKSLDQREYVKLNREIKVSLSATKEFYDFFKDLYQNNKLRYDMFLGHSESLVSIENIILK